MRKRRVYALMAGLVAVAAVGLMLAFVVIPGSAGDMKSSVVAVGEVAAAPGSPAEGIAVHGHWTIEVRNPDGSLVVHREFDNALQSRGNETIISILAREKVAGRWNVVVVGSPTPPCRGSSTDMNCSVSEATEPGTAPDVFKTLTVTKAGTGDAAKLVLSGRVTIANTTNINQVATNLKYCSPTVSLADCATAPASTDNAYITVANLLTTIPVTAGQEVQVIVEISFS